MYFLFRFKKWKPSEYIELGNNERMVIKLFMDREIEDRNKEFKEW